MKKVFICILSFALLMTVFVGCDSLTVDPSNLENPEHIEKKESPISDFRYEEHEDGGIIIQKYLGNDKEVVIPKTIDGKNVTCIGPFAFKNNKTVEHVEMPDTVKVIRETAFQNATSLKKVVLSNQLEEILKSAFEGCTSLSDVELPNTLRKLWYRAFAECTSLKSINIPKSLTEWDAETFVYCEIEEIVLEEGLELIAATAFAYTKIKEITLPSSIKTIEWGAFGACYNLERVTLNEGLLCMGDELFTGSKIAEIVIPASVIDVSEMTFSGCSSLDKVKFEGNAPECFIKEYPLPTEPENVHYTIYYHDNAIGFASPEWNGYPTAIW